MSDRPYRQVKSSDVPDLLRQGAAIVDVRRPEEWYLTGVVKGAHLLTFFDQRGNSDPHQWLQSLNQAVSRYRDLVLICRSGHRTALICEFLADTMPARTLFNVSDGMLGWLASGLPAVPRQDKYPADITSEMSFSNPAIDP